MTWEFVLLVRFVGIQGPAIVRSARYYDGVRIGTGPGMLTYQRLLRFDTTIRSSWGVRSAYLPVT